jgi:hypothetical protein
MGSHGTKPVCMGIFKFVWWQASKQYFDQRDHYSEPILTADMDPNIPERGSPQQQYYIAIKKKLTSLDLSQHRPVKKIVFFSFQRWRF